MPRKINPVSKQAHDAVMTAMLRRALNGDHHAARNLLAIQAETIPFADSNATILSLANLINNPVPDKTIEEIINE